jgi:hypothetical protein
MFYVCSECHGSFKTPKQLIDHRRKKHTDTKGENRAAMEITLAELKRGGRLDPIDEAKVQMVRSLADELDRDPTNAQMWRTYDEVVKDLTADDTSLDDFDKLKEEILSRAPVGNPKET